MAMALASRASAVSSVSVCAMIPEPTTPINNRAVPMNSAVSFWEVIGGNLCRCEFVVNDGIVFGNKSIKVATIASITKRDVTVQTVV